MANNESKVNLALLNIFPSLLKQFFISNKDLRNFISDSLKLLDNFYNYVKSIKTRSDKYIKSHTPSIPMPIYLFTWINNLDNGFISAANTFIFMQSSSLPGTVKWLMIISVFICNTINPSLGAAFQNTEIFSKIKSMDMKSLTPNLVTVAALTASIFNFGLSYVASSSMLKALGVQSVNIIQNWSMILSLLNSFCFFTFLLSKGKMLVSTALSLENWKKKTKIMMVCLLNVLAIGAGIHLYATSLGLSQGLTPALKCLYYLSFGLFLNGLFVYYKDGVQSTLESLPRLKNHNMPMYLWAVSTVAIVLNGLANYKSVELSFLGPISNLILATNTVSISLLSNYSSLIRIQQVFYSQNKQATPEAYKTLPQITSDKIRLAMSLFKILLISITMSRYGITHLKRKSLIGLGFTAWTLNDKNASYVKIGLSDFSTNIQKITHPGSKSNPYLKKTMFLPSLFCKKIVDQFMVGKEVENSHNT